MQNTQDRKIPVINVQCNQEFGIGMAIDIEGNCRFYDLIRYKKMAKVTTHAKDKSGGRFQLMQGESLTMMNEYFVATTASSHTDWDESLRVYKEREDEPAENAPKKGKKDAQEEEEPLTPPEEIPVLTEFEILQDKKFSDDPERYKTLA